jgi:hypothetical protein
MKQLRIYIDTSVFGGCFDWEGHKGIFLDANIFFSAAYGNPALEMLWDEVKKIDDPFFSLDNRSYLSVLIYQGIITMKKTILPFLMLLISLLLPVVSDASYIIHLENGGRFLTPQYWEEDNYVKFYIAGGMMGIEKKSVRKIERSTIDLDGIYEMKKPEKRPAEAEPKAEKILSPQEPREKIDLKAYQDKMATLKAEANETRARLREAIKNKDRDAETKAAEDRRKIADETRKLSEELKGKNNGKLPVDWYD